MAREETTKLGLEEKGWREEGREGGGGLEWAREGGRVRGSMVWRGGRRWLGEDREVAESEV